MIRISIDIPEELQKLPDDIMSKAIPLVVKELANKGQDEMFKRAPKRTGFFRLSITSRVSDREAWIGPQGSEKLARYLEKGTLEHEIRPVRALALRFKTKDQVVFAKRAMHPGTSATWFMRDTARWLGDQVPEIWKRAIEEVTRE